MGESLRTAQSILWMIEQVKNRGAFEYEDWAREFRTDGPLTSAREDRKFLNHLKLFRERALDLLSGSQVLSLKADRGRYFLGGALNEAAWDRITDPEGKNYLPLLLGLSARRSLVPLPAPRIEKGLLDAFDVPQATLGRILYKDAFTWRFDPGYVDVFLNAIHTGTKLFIRPTGDRKAGFVTPLYLINYAGAWYLLAYRYGLAQYNLSRVTELSNSEYPSEKVSRSRLDSVRKVAQETFGIYLVTDWDHLSEGALSTVRYRGRALPYARERFDPNQRQETDPWFSIVTGEDWIDVTVKVFESTELVTELLKWGVDAEAIAPEAFRQAWLDRIRELAHWLD